MTPFRFVILGLLAWLVFRVVRSWGSEALPGKPKPRSPEEFEMMARCLRCKTYVPRHTLNDDGHCRSCRSGA